MSSSNNYVKILQKNSRLIQKLWDSLLGEHASLSNTSHTLNLHTCDQIETDLKTLILQYKQDIEIFEGQNLELVEWYKRYKYHKNVFDTTIQKYRDENTEKKVTLFIRSRLWWWNTMSSEYFTPIIPIGPSVFLHSELRRDHQRASPSLCAEPDSGVLHLNKWE